MKLLIATIALLACLEPLGAGAQTSGKPGCVSSIPIPNHHWRGEYFNHRELGGSPALVRDDGADALDFNWGAGNPATGCITNADDFSVRWSRAVAFSQGVYRFTATADDGVRLFIDGQPQFDQWHQGGAKQGAKTFVADITLTAGNHRVVVEFVERGGDARLKLYWEPHPCLAKAPAKTAADHWRGEYFNRRDLSGAPALVRDDGAGALGFDWKLGGPSADCGVGVDNFSARWQRTMAFVPGVYRFRVTADDGVRVYVDDQLKLDKWVEQMADHSFTVELTAGNHRLVVEYFEHYGSATLKLAWEPDQCFANVPPDRWRGEYFNDGELGGKPALVRDDGGGMLEFDWRAGSPSLGCGVNTDNFSARWTRMAALSTGTYRFTVSGDDGVRFFLDGEKLLDQWAGATQPVTIEATVAGGNHRLRLEYCDRAGQADVKLTWQQLTRAGR